MSLIFAHPIAFGVIMTVVDVLGALGLVAWASAGIKMKAIEGDVER